MGSGAGRGRRAASTSTRSWSSPRAGGCGSGRCGPTWAPASTARGTPASSTRGSLWELRSQGGWFLELGLGAALHDGKLSTDDDDRKELGTRVLFRIPIELGVAFGERHRLSLLFDHVSNASLGDENEGLGTLGLGYGLRF